MMFMFYACQCTPSIKGYPSMFHWNQTTTPFFKQYVAPVAACCIISCHSVVTAAVVVVGMSSELELLHLCVGRFWKENSDSGWWCSEWMIKNLNPTAWVLLSARARGPGTPEIVFVHSRYWFEFLVHFLYAQPELCSKTPNKMKVKVVATLQSFKSESA